MTRLEKERFKNNLKMFYMASIKNAGGFNRWEDDWLFWQAHKIYNISHRTAVRYLFQFVPEDFLKEYEY